MVLYCAILDWYHSHISLAVVNHTKRCVDWPADWHFTAQLSLPTKQQVCVRCCTYIIHEGAHVCKFCACNFCVECLTLTWLKGFAEGAEDPSDCTAKHSASHFHPCSSMYQSSFVTCMAYASLLTGAKRSKSNTCNVIEIITETMQ